MLLDAKSSIQDTPEINSHSHGPLEMPQYSILSLQHLRACSPDIQLAHAGTHAFLFDDGLEAVQRPSVLWLLGALDLQPHLQGRASERDQAEPRKRFPWPAVHKAGSQVAFRDLGFQGGAGLGV